MQSSSPTGCVSTSPRSRFRPEESRGCALHRACRIVVTVHGFGRRVLQLLLLGGGIGSSPTTSARRCGARSRVRHRDRRRRDPRTAPRAPRSQPGQPPRDGGVQIELPPRVRDRARCGGTGRPWLTRTPNRSSTASSMQPPVARRLTLAVSSVAAGTRPPAPLLDLRERRRRGRGQGQGRDG